MKRQDGIALIATLLIMAAIVALGVGTLFLSDMNLRIAGNSSAHAIARYNAESGLDAAIIQLTKEYGVAKRFPTSLTLPSSPASEIIYQAVSPSSQGYSTNTARTTAVVRISGRGPNNAQYVAEAFMAVAINPAFLKGLASEGNIRVSGGGNAEFVNAGIHGNTGEGLPGYSNSNFRTCATPTQEFSTCPITDPLPVSSSDGTNCYMTGCDPWAPRVQIDPAYALKRNDAIAIDTFGLVHYRDANNNLVSDGMGGVLYADPASPSVSININPEANPTVYGSRCTVVYTSTPPTITSVAEGAKICAIGSGVTLNFASGIDMKNATVIADGDITFSGPNPCAGTCAAGTLENTKLISRTRIPPTATLNDPNDARGGVMLDIVTGKNLTIFSGANRDVASSSPYYLIGEGFKLAGNTIIASNRDIQFAGTTYLTTYPDKPGAVTTAIISTRRITNSGSSNFYGVFWAGTCFAQSGSAKIYGTIAVREAKCTTGGNPSAIDISGKLHINSSYAVDNSSLYGGMAVASRR